MTRYTTMVTAESSGASEVNMMELLPPASRSIALVRIKVTKSGTSVADGPNEIRVLRTSNNGVGGIAGTIVKRKPYAPAAVTSVTIKNASNSYTVGVIADTVARFTYNIRGAFEWIARDDRDKIWSGVNQNLCIALNASDTQNYDVQVDFEE